jgi:hypothetical protein
MGTLKIIARYADGKMLKGTTENFWPDCTTFHVTPVDAERGAPTVPVSVGELKAVFMVRDFDGDPEYVDKKAFDERTPYGKRLVVTFKDGEELWGASVKYDRTGTGFFLFPADPDTNNERIFVINAAVDKVREM